MAEKSLLIERRDKVALLTMNRPDNLNALNKDLQDNIIAACEQIRNDDDIWAVVLTGAGRGFSSGADLRPGGPRPDGPIEQSRQERIDVYGWVGRLSTAVYRTVDKPTIAAINGVAAGAGMSIALACDIRIGTPNSRFKVVFLERSLCTDTGMSFFLPRIVGYSRACDLIFTSRFVNADEAYRIGLLDRIVPVDKLMDESIALANQIASLPPVAMQVARRVLQQSMESSFEEQLRNESNGLIMARRAPHDMQEQRDSFVQKRAPKFTGK
jgi:2-(1,2-epoxy-1,2-dihydrophenyl)acetyl-CoA isomerase